MKNQHDRKTICKGCAVQNRGCFVSPFYKDRECPCLTCLIKSMCSEGCDERTKYWGHVSVSTQMEGDNWK